MVSFIKKLFGSNKAQAPLYFKDAEAAFQYACQFLSAELTSKAILPALVVDAREALGADSPVLPMPNGGQMLALRVCAKDGGFLVLAGTISATGPTLHPGHLVAWQAGQPIERQAEELNKDPRSNWVGAVLAKLKPEYTVGRGWSIDEPFK
ncbi:hypothetical protein [Methylophilus sp. DW102]|uniref:hypothetical protein n=1 Tax=Methylophilus sp. DW102 TaxID=3095607 RepID=UPI003089293D|nr:hypothetical protein MTDW_08710 [Methylophilus sp. DW102]